MVELWYIIIDNVYLFIFYLEGYRMKNTFKAISLLLVILTVASCFVGCGIQNVGFNSGALGNNVTADLATNGGYTENNATENHKNTTSSNAKEERAEHFSNADSPIAVMVPNAVTFFNLKHSLKREGAISVIFAGSVISISE